MATRAENTGLLIDASKSDPVAAAALVPVVYDELRHLAAGILRGERPGLTLHATDLVHEAYLRLIDQTRASMENRRHFLAIAAQQMRRILIDAARRKKTAKRGGEWQRITLGGVIDPQTESEIDIERLEQALQTLSGLHARQAQIVELRYFGGLTVAEVAEVLEVSERTVADDWRMAKAWLFAHLSTPRESTE